GGAAAPTIHGILAAEARGAHPLVLRADTADAAEMRIAVAKAREAFGALHGVVHAAGLGGGAEPAPLAHARPGETAELLSHVARELAALDAATAGLALDFRIVQNSNLSVFGAAGLSGACAAFALSDAWTQARVAAGGGRWTSVDWDRWHLESEGGPAGGAGAERAILRNDAPRVFSCLAALADEPRVVVSTHDLEARLERFRAPRVHAAASADGGQAEDARHERPAAAGEYHAPETEAEQLLAEIWGELLGIRQVGTRDSFFDLGGHSLLGIQVLSRVRETFQVELPLRAVFEAPTIGGLAALVDEAILAELDAMSDEEAESALAGVAARAGFAHVLGGVQ
ncbi:MAG TPA: phosphopantetheine-binding protein, partial [Longimicrobiaceae bacterium]